MTYPLQREREGFPVQLVPFIHKEQLYDNGTFTFLNRAHSFGEGVGSIDWEFGEYGKLWSYNLNYFDVLLQPGMTREFGLALIESFLAALHQGSVGLEPYPLSLRGINGIKFLVRHQVQRADITGALFAHYTILARNLEYHLLGNHLLENAFSLLYGAFFFREKRWFEKSRALLVRELDEQILGDGAHFELSPMYHQILLDRLLDCINLLQHNDCFAAQHELLHLSEGKAVAMLSWLKVMTFSDGTIPHVNDATDGIAPFSQQLFEYAAWLGLKNIAFQSSVQLKESGYRKCRNSWYECVVDAGSIGPSYIPGHAHADTLNFVLQVQGEPMFVDTGISTYEKNLIRDEERSTVAHNTVVVNGRNSSEAFFHYHHTITPELSGNRVVTEHADLIVEGSQQIEIRKYMQALGYNRRVEAWCVVVSFSNTLITTIVCKK